MNHVRKGPSIGISPSNAAAIVVISLITVLAVKFFSVLLLVDGPVAYDTGINRYLFLKYAETFPFAPDLGPWFREHSPALYYAFAPLLRLGLPVDWVTGWLWNAYCVFLVGVLAYVTGKRYDVKTGVAVLVVALCSKAYFDGLTFQYWKTYAALLLAVASFELATRRKKLTVLPLVLCVFTHHQTALIAVPSVACWWLWDSIRRGAYKDRRWRLSTAIAAGVLSLFLLWYVLENSAFVGYQLRFILGLHERGSYGGNFAPLMAFLRWTPFLLAAGLYGFCMSFREEKATPWRFAVLWCMLFVLLRLYFYRRFFLLLDFFLMPYAAKTLWRCIRPEAPGRLRAFAILFTVTQVVISLAFVHAVMAPTEGFVIRHIQDFSRHIEADATLIVPENQTAPAILGWAPSFDLIAPGLFGNDWPQKKWDTFVFGTTEERKEIVSQLPVPTYVVLAPAFHRLYTGDNTDSFLSDPCFEAVQGTILLRIICHD